jgi:hypothetical protein
MNCPHTIMLEYYINLMADLLIEVNGGIGTRDDFIGTILNGFAKSEYEFCGYTEEYIAFQLELFNSFISNPDSIGGLIKQCE